MNTPVTLKTKDFPNDKVACKNDEAAHSIISLSALYSVFLLKTNKLTYRSVNSSKVFKNLKVGHLRGLISLFTYNVTASDNN